MELGTPSYLPYGGNLVSQDTLAALALWSLPGWEAHGDLLHLLCTSNWLTNPAVQLSLWDLRQMPLGPGGFRTLLALCDNASQAIAHVRLEFVALAASAWALRAALPSLLVAFSRWVCFSAGACGAMLRMSLALRCRAKFPTLLDTPTEPERVTVASALLHVAYHQRLEHKLRNVLNLLSVRWHELRDGVLTRMPALCWQPPVPDWQFPPEMLTVWQSYPDIFVNNGLPIVRWGLCWMMLGRPWPPQRCPAGVAPSRLSPGACGDLAASDPDPLFGTILPCAALAHLPPTFANAYGWPSGRPLASQERTS